MTILELLISNGYAPGSYFNVCHECKTEFIGDKRAITCLECASKRVGNVAEPNAYSLLADVRAELLKELLTVFIDLLDEAKCYYHLYPNSHRGTVEEYFEIEDKLIKKVSEHFS